MLAWFERAAPIRMKFRAMLAVHMLLTATGLVTTLVAGNLQWDSWPVLLSALAVLLTALFVPLCSRMICTPYVNTVVRMEGLATGDIDGPVRYTDYRDCVGRMTKAMAVFRENALIVRQAVAAQDEQTRMVSAMQAGLGRLAANDLSYELTDRFPERYEQLRVDYNAAVTALRHAIVAVANLASDIRIGSNEIRSASDDLAARTEQQAAAIEKTTSAMNQVNTGVRDNANSAREVNAAVGSVHGEASDGGQIVERAVEAMNAINESSQEISQIVGVIDGIAFQTNLLALNAGVEAARAGDAGKGFAVVATEVRALAQRSADAAKAIKDLITKSTQLVGAGVGLVDETGQALDKIVLRIGEVRGNVQEIADSAAHQSGNLAHVGASITEMDRTTQQNAAMVEQSAAAARNLAQQADQLGALVGAFTTGPGTAESGRVYALPGARPEPSARPAPPPRAIPAPRAQQSGNLALRHAPAPEWSEF